MFDLEDDDYEAIRLATDAAKELLNDLRINPVQSTILKKALNALNHLPQVTPDASYQFGIVYRDGDDNYNEMRFITFTITENMLEIAYGGSEFDSLGGGGSLPTEIWMLEVGGARMTDLEIDYTKLDLFTGFLNMGAKIKVFEGDELE